MDHTMVSGVAVSLHCMVFQNAQYWVSARFASEYPVTMIQNLRKRGVAPLSRIAPKEYARIAP